MIEIKNKTRGPIPVLVRSGTAPREFTTLVIPGIGVGKNIRMISDEMVIQDVVERLEKSGLVSTRYVSNRVGKGE
jgi:hypothetical protein